MKVMIPYGDNLVSADLTGLRVLDTLDIAEAPELANVSQVIAHAIAHPIGLEKNVFQTIAPKEKVVILVSDMFRQTRADQVLPVLLEGLNHAGVRDEDICLLFATGTHRAPTPEEQARILGEATHARFRGRTLVHNAHDEANLVEVGVTSRGTPVIVNRMVQEADHVIATGSVVMHYFGGYGGGRKSVVPGVSSAKTIAHNHAMNLDPLQDRRNPAVRIGVLDGNPVAEDMYEGARMVGVDYVINTVLNRHGRIAGIFAGELDAAHRAAAAFARRLYAVTINEPADIVVASSGGAKNFVQSHKALYNAYQAVKPAGRIILLTQNLEGLGGEQFTKWLRLGGPTAIIAGLRKQAEINGQTALSTLEKAPITLFVTEMSAEDVALMGGRKAPSLQDAVIIAKKELAAAGVSSPTCYLMPSASYTVPFLPNA